MIHIYYSQFSFETQHSSASNEGDKPSINQNNQFHHTLRARWKELAEDTCGDIPGLPSRSRVSDGAWNQDPCCGILLRSGTPKLGEFVCGKHGHFSNLHTPGAWNYRKCHRQVISRRWKRLRSRAFVRQLTLGSREDSSRPRPRRWWWWSVEEFAEKNIKNDSRDFKERGGRFA